MKKSSIIANLVVSCICLAISFPLCFSSGLFGIIIFGFALFFVINYSVKLANYSEQQEMDNQEQDIFHKQFSVSWLIVGAILLIVLLKIVCD